MNRPQNMSTHEFQAQLMSWYDDKGILADLRTQLRFKLINVLRNTAIGRDIARKTSHAIPLSKQVINLIVAEFLMKNGCEYSLSLFNTEAGLSNTYSDNMINEIDRLSIQFNKENIFNILELIGINKTSCLCDEILSIYYDNNENISLLSCLINILSKPYIEKYIKPSDFKQKCCIDLTNETKFVRKVGASFINLDLPENTILHLIGNIKFLHENEMANQNRCIQKLQKKLMIKDKLLESVDKKKKSNEIKFAKVMEEFNAMKRHNQFLIKDKLTKEQELNKLKQHNSNKVKEVIASSIAQKEVNTSCNLIHCGTSCKENNMRLLQLQNNNQDLQKRHSDLIQHINFLQKKVDLLNIKIESKPSSYLNLETFPCEIKHRNKSFIYKKLDGTDNSSSTTEDLLKDAWQKLEQFQNENIEIEKQYMEQ